MSPFLSFMPSAKAIDTYATFAKHSNAITKMI